MTNKLILLGFIALIAPSLVAQEKPENGQIKTTKLATLPKALSETSGAIFYHERLWTHNDSGGKPEVSAIDPATGNETARITITNATNTDWEDITQDSTSIYLTDAGNNLGNRKEFQIYRISKADINPNGGFQLLKSEVITFRYNNQPELSLPYNHNFDCEAIACINGKLHLFTKNWASRNCNIYLLDQEQKMAIYQESIESGGLITGADYDTATDRLVLCGYNIELLVFKPFIIEVANFTKENKVIRKYLLPLKEHQVEGICLDGQRLVITNEETSNIDQKIYPASIFEVETIQ